MHTKSVDSKMSAGVAYQFALLFDGCTSGRTQYIACFISYLAETGIGYKSILLSFGRSEDKDDLGADSLLKFINFAMSIYKKALQNTSPFVRDTVISTKAHQQYPTFH